MTFLFTDIEGSTRLAQMLGVGYRPVLVEHRRLLGEALSACDGTPLFTEGDSLFVAFPDAGAALRACADAQRALAGYTWPSVAARPLVRMGLHTGYAEPYAGEYASPEVHRAARIAAAAHGSQVLCSAATAREAGELDDASFLLDLGLHRLRGFDARERLYQLVAPGLPRRFPRPRTLDETRHNLPDALTSFVGREAEQREVAGLMDRHRLVTVVGPAGAGKTRLTLAVAGQQVDDHPDGVWFVDLAEVTDPASIVGTVAAALGLRPEPGRPMTETLAEYASTHRFLLVLDTCDAHPGAVARMVGRLLTDGRGVRVLATGRGPLGLAGEVVWRIPPLRVGSGPGGAHSEATTLLLDRTTAARGGTRPDDSEMADLNRVAERLEGLPLALELAAARLRVLSAGELADRLDDPLSALDAGSSVLDTAVPAGAAPEGPADRHATIKGAVRWSYRTLGPRAARLLRWMSVFAGRVDLASIAALMDEDPLAPLAVLVDKSLVQADIGPNGSTYRMLDPIRACAAALLADAGEEEAARGRHVAWSLHAVRRAQSGVDGRPLTLSLYALDPLAEQVRTALRWSASRGSARDGLLVVAGLDHWWRERGMSAEARRWLSRLYDRMAATGERVPDAELAAAYQMHSVHAGVDRERAEELRLSHQAEQAARRSGDPALLALALAGRGRPLFEMGDPVGAERACREAISWAHEHGVEAEALAAVYYLAQMLWRRGALDEAAELVGAARPVEATRPAERSRRTVDMTLGMIALARSDLVAAHDHLTVALRSRMGYGFHSRACESLNGFAVRCALGGDFTTAARLFGAAQAARSRLRHSSGIYAGYWAEQQTEVRRVLGDGEFDVAYAHGARLSLEDAVAAALAVEHPDLAVGSGRFSDVDSRAS